MNTKTKTKALTLALCALLLAAATALTSLAFLKSYDAVNNTFTVGKVAITLDEAKVDEYGTADTAAGRVKQNTYKLVPGHRYTKDPTVHFAAKSEASYLFVKVENGLSAIEAGTTIEGQILANGWKKLNETNGIYYKKVGANQTNSAVDYPVFAEFTVADTADITGYETAEINVTAYAVQSDGFNTAWAAWSAGGFE